MTCAPTLRKALSNVWGHFQSILIDFPHSHSRRSSMSPVLETNLASRWEGVRLPRASGKSPDFPGGSPNFAGSFLVTSPEVLSLWNLTAIQRFSGSSPDFPGSSPDFPGGQPLSLGSLTPSPDSQKLSLTGSVFSQCEEGGAKQHLHSRRQFLQKNPENIILCNCHAIVPR